MTTLAEERADKAGWGFQEGDLMAPGLHAVRHLGGGHRYEAYLALDDRRRYLVVTKILRPDQLEDAGALRGLRREARILEVLDHPVSQGIPIGGDLDDAVLCWHTILDANRLPFV